MKIKILRIYEQNNILRIETECEFGKDNLGLSIQQKYLDPVTGKPRYLKEVRKLIESKYNKELAKEKEIKDEYVGKTLTLETM